MADAYLPYDPNQVDRIVRGFAEGGAVDADETKAAFGIYPKQRATPSSKETKAAAAEAAQFAADMLIPQTPMDAGLMLIPSAGIARKAGAALIALDAGDAEASPLTKLLKAVKGSVKDPEVVKDAVKEHKMLQGVYRGYAGENVPAKTALGTETYFISPQKRVADYYAQRRAAETGTVPHAEMMLIDPATLRNQPYNLSIPVDKYNRDFLVTRARRVDPDEAKSRTQLYADGGSVSAYDPSRVDAIVNEFM